MTHPFDTYTRKHAHGPRIRLNSGVQKLTIEFNRGYVRIATSPPFSGEVYVTRSAFMSLLPKVIPFVRLWQKHPAPDFDVPASVHAAYLMEQEFDAAQRAEKKSRGVDPQSAREMDKKRRRYLAARARARKKHHLE
jgi:hypothetical protein